VQSIKKSEEKTVVDNEVYIIRDLNLYDSKGRVVFTISTTILKASQQTFGHKHENDAEVYEFIEGYGEMILDKTTVNVSPGDYVYVEESKYHKVINLSKSTDLVFKCYFNGEIKRPHLK
jgi:oxalate decarboxylase/phosphoglucose isomerase-like protein (cupin superfamily)